MEGPIQPMGTPKEEGNLFFSLHVGRRESVSIWGNFLTWFKVVTPYSTFKDDARLSNLWNGLRCYFIFLTHSRAALIALGTPPIWFAQHEPM
jgi:hypothetical protein